MLDNHLISIGIQMVSINDGIHWKTLVKQAFLLCAMAEYKRSMSWEPWKTISKTNVLLYRFSYILPQGRI